ncbi:hypothetical protein PS706_04695 [Pseudomonas fluorescens]|nr:hypothetical protein PS706_04695 [Pseudomonas fluorescens]
MLGEVAHHRILATGQAAGQRRKLARQVLDQCRFTRTVGAEQTDARTRRELQLHFFQDGFVAITQACIGKIQQRAGDLHRLAEHEVERRIDVRRRQFLHALQRLDPALGLAGLGGLGLEAGDVAFHVRALRLLLLVGLLLLGQAFGASTFERGVAATVERDFLLFDVGNVVDHGVEKIPVVGDQQQGALIILEEVFQPQDRIEVQVVGRFVEQQQVRRAHQRLCKVQAHAPAAREVGDRAVHLFVGKTKAGEHLAGAGVGGVAVGAVQLGMQASLGGAVLGFLGLGQVVLHLAQAQVAIEHVVDRDAVQGVDLLAHMGDAPVGGQQAVPGIRGQLTQQQGEQRGFAGAVGTDQAGFVTGVQGQLGVFEKTLRATL